MTAKLLPLLPAHRTYVEPFGGGASMLFAKSPSVREAYNDLNSGLVNLFRVCKDYQKFRKLYALSKLTPHSREEYDYLRDHLEDSPDDVEAAYRWFYVARQSFGGNFGKSYGTSITTSCHGMASTTNAWLNAIESLNMIHERLKTVHISNDDFREVIGHWDAKDTLFYLDPPYVPETRKGGEYKHEMTLSDHEELVRILLGMKGMGMLSGYNAPVYQPLLDAGWACYEWHTACMVAGRTRGTGIKGEGAALKTQARTECAWISPNIPLRRLTDAD